MNALPLLPSLALQKNRRRLGYALLLLALAWWTRTLFPSPIYDEVPRGFYGEQTHAFRAGQLHLFIEAHPELARLENPYLGEANRPYRVLDLSYFEGRYYSYFGITPILLLTMPWHLITGTFLTEPGATWLLLLAFYLVAAALLRWLVNHHFPAVNPLTEWLAFGVIALGSGTGVLLHGINPGTVAQASAYLCLVAAFYAGARSTTGSSPATARRWLVLAATAVGLAIGSRPSFIPALLLIPAALAPLVLRPGLTPADRGRALLAAGLPLTVIAAGLMAYNHLRFDSVLEFGNRLQLTNDDYREMRMFGFDFLAARGAAFWTAPLNFSGSFPFLRLAGSGQPVGLLWMIPVSWLALGWFVPLRSVRTLYLWTFPAVFAGLWLFLATYRLFLFHYQIDFMVAWTWVAVLGWWRLLAREGWASSTVFRITVGALASATVLIGAIFPLALRDPSEHRHAIARTANHIASSIEAWRGNRHGFLTLNLTLPPEGLSPGQAVPVLSSGAHPGDLVILEALPEPDRARLVLFHTGAGGPRSEAFDAPAGATLHLDLRLGSLLPVTEHPMFDAWSQTDRTAALHLVRIAVNHQPVLDGFARFYPTTPGEIRIGQNPHLPGMTTPTFPGQIRVLSRRLPTLNDLPVRPHGTGAARFTVVLGRELQKEENSPLISTGRGGAGDLWFLRRDPDGQVRLLHDNWGRIFRSLPITVAPNRAHVLEIQTRSLAGAGESFPRTQVWWDGEPIFDLSYRTYPSAANEVFWGLNLIGSSYGGTLFHGEFTAVESVAPRAKDALHPRYIPGQPVKLAVELASLQLHESNPLLVTGQTGAADFFYVVRDSLDTVRVGFDHWGAGGLLGEPVSFDPNRPQVLQITAPHLHTDPAFPRATQGPYTVTLDGEIVLEGDSGFHPFNPAEYFLLRNPVGGSTTSATFRGTGQPLEYYPPPSPPPPDES